MKMTLKQGITIGILVSLLLTLVPVNAQSARSLNCGDIIEGELTPNDSMHEYTINVQAGTTIDIIVEPIGNAFNPYLLFYDSGGGEFALANANKAGVAEQLLDYQISSTNSKLSVYGAFPNSEGRYASAGEYFGAYIASLGCTLRDGTVINAGDAAPPAVSNLTSPSSLASVFSGTGFPGLAPVDFTNGITIPFTAGVPNTGSVSSGFEGVFGFTLDVNAGETYAFDFSKISGNLNLGIAILSPDNKIVFYGGMIASSRLATDVLFPSAGQYTIGVFRVDLLPPDTLEATAFQVTATLQ